MAELDLGKVVMDSYSDLDNKPKINEVELRGNKTLEDLGIQQLIDAVNVSRLSKDIFAPSFETLEDFVVATATDVSVPHFGRMYINTRNWGFGTSQIRYLITYMKAYTVGVLDVLGSGIFWDDTNTMWHVEIHGGIGELYIQHYKIEPNQIPTNNLLATEAGTPLDAVQGKVLNKKITQINTILDDSGETFTKTASSVSIPNGITTKLATITIPAGTYIVNANALFSGNTSGMRAVAISSAASVNATNVISNGVSANPWTNLSTRVRYTSNVTYTKETEVSVYGYQNSGSDLVAESAAISAVRVK